ncbi:MAG TPA: bifunctional helix-turn-helix transcriptional regulator/GNAT family N-acetyltransferase [Steroidobacteraceae bacterium]|nr:bifunctional helix-turn-helix transcriptional regulator/GNAT family N-acetyltransferase [Steroidobacteraceae bacterium]
MRSSRSTEPHISAVREFNRFYTQKIGVLGGGLLDSAYTLTEVRVLYEIAHRQRPLASDLVRDLALDAGYLSRILAKFARRGWLKRERSGDDARKAHLHLTAKGRATFQSLDVRARDEIGTMLAPLQPEQQLKLQGHLQNVQSLLGAQPAPNRELTLREHRPGDMGWIVQKHGALYAQEYGWNGEFEALVAEICAKFLRELDPSGERCWIAERAGLPVGCIMLVRHSRTVAKLRLLLVDPSQRGMGVGNALVEACLAFAREAGYRKVTLWTQSILNAARKLYEAHGFRKVAAEAHESFGAKLVAETWDLDLQDAR